MSERTAETRAVKILDKVPKKLEDLKMDHEEELRRLQEQLKRTEEGWQADTVMWRARQTELDGRVEELRDCLADADSSGKQVVDALSRRIKATDTLLGYLRSKARIMVIPQYAFASCGIKNEEGVGLVDKRGTPMSHWGDNLDLQLLERHVGLLKPDNTEDSDMPHGLLDQGDGEYVERIASAVMQITEVMELLVKRAIVAESVLGAEKQKSQTSQQEIQEKCAQIEKMWARVEEMERVALGTTGALKDMQLKLEDMELETSKQRIRAADNERELSRVKHDFGILRSSVDNLVKARDRMRSMETRIQDVEKVSESLTSRVLGLEAGKRRQDAEIARLMSENESLRAGLDFKEAELSALGAQIRILCQQPERSVGFEF